MIIDKYLILFINGEGWILSFKNIRCQGKNIFPRTTCDMWHSHVDLLFQKFHFSHQVYNYVLE
jgi:hypothetical protein